MDLLSVSGADVVSAAVEEKMALTYVGTNMVVLKYNGAEMDTKENGRLRFAASARLVVFRQYGSRVDQAALASNVG
jgi:hypothetical protein